MWSITTERLNSRIYALYKDLHIVDNIKIIRREWARHSVRVEEEMIPKGS